MSTHTGRTRAAPKQHANAPDRMLRLSAEELNITANVDHAQNMPPVETGLSRHRFCSLGVQALWGVEEPQPEESGRSDLTQHLLPKLKQHSHGAETAADVRFYAKLIGDTNLLASLSWLSPCG